MKEEELHISESTIISYLRGDALLDVEREKIEAWLENRENQKEAQRVYQLWELSLVSSTVREDIDEAFDKVSQRLFTKKEEIGKNGARLVIMPSWRWMAAASIAIAMLVTGKWFWGKSEDSIALAVLSEKKEFWLEDKSRLSLNEQSTLRYDKGKMGDDSSYSREVWLTGEAFFEVEPDANRPFIVHTVDAKITVLGTKFLVKVIENAPTKVLVTEGKVQVDYLESGQKIILEEEEEVVLDNDQETLKVSTSDKNQLYWKTGIMKFEKQTLQHVLNVLSEEFDVIVVSENEEIFSCELTATFKKQSLETIMKVIDTTHDLKSHISSDTLNISGNGCH